MKYKLIKDTNPEYSAIEQILTNRGVEYENIRHYLNTTDEDINDFDLLGHMNLENAARELIYTINNNLKVGIIVDCDVDGYCSSSLMINYLHELFPSWVENNLVWFHHTKKQHGLSDLLDKILDSKVSLILCLDCGTNDLKEHAILKENKCEVIVMDHHLQKEASKDAIIINNQCSKYPNKNMCGCGIVWQFCRYLDSILRTNFSNNYLDLVALALTGDMMSLLSIETRHLITKGFMTCNIHNPFILYMWNKNKFKLRDNITSWGAAFYIVPFLNAITRSGTMDEKEIVFSSLINHLALKEVPSTKRGHDWGEMETIADQAIRICSRVKNRQTKIVNQGMEILERRIEENDMMCNKVLLFLNNNQEIESTVAGLVANKIMDKYQRPCCVLSRQIKEDEPWYIGSARGCDIIGITDFKQICDDSGSVEETIGHPGAFGCFIKEKNISPFISSTNEILKDMPSEPIYRVDYIFKDISVDGDKILDIADLDYLWGKDIQPSLIAIEGLKVTKDMLRLMGGENNPTLKISLPNKVSIIKFKSSEEEYESLLSEGYTKINIIGECNRNEFNGIVTPQLFLKDYEIIEYQQYCF